MSPQCTANDRETNAPYIEHCVRRPTAFDVGATTASVSRPFVRFEPLALIKEEK